MKDGGLFENIKFVDLNIRTTGQGDHKRQVFPVIVDLEKRAEDSRIGAVRHIDFNNVTIASRGRCMISGMESAPIEGIAFDNVQMHIPVCDAAVNSSKPRGIVKLSTPPLGTDFSNIPSHFILSNVNDILFHNVQVHVDSADLTNSRHVLWGRQLSDVTIDGLRIKATNVPSSLAILHFTNCSDVFIRGSQAPRFSSAFLQLEGAHTQNIHVTGNNFFHSKVPFVLSDDVDPDSFFESDNRLR